MLFSIIVSVYNVEKYLDRCIQSIIGQSFKDFELLLINDGSTDGSLKICKKYEETDSRIKVINNENGGPVSARKIGAENAVGEYIICADGDDYVKDGYLLQTSKDINTGVVLIFYGYDLIDENGASLGEHMDRVPEGFYTRDNMDPIFDNFLYSSAVK